MCDEDWGWFVDTECHDYTYTAHTPTTKFLRKYARAPTPVKIPVKMPVTTPATHGLCNEDDDDLRYDTLSFGLTTAVTALITYAVFIYM